MSNRGQFRPIPWATSDALPGDRSASQHYEVVAHFAHVLLAGYKGHHTQVSEVFFSPDEARRLGFHLMAVADVIENKEEGS